MLFRFFFLGGGGKDLPVLLALFGGDNGERDPADFANNIIGSLESSEGVSRKVSPRSESGADEEAGDASSSSSSKASFSLGTAAIAPASSAAIEMTPLAKTAER